MSETLDPDAIRTRTFSTGRRGFERAEVEAFLEQVASHVSDLQNRIDLTDARLNQLGITELPDLKLEIDTLGEDVREILQAARDAAEDMRDRANADAAARIAEAQQQAEELRRTAWETSTQMLEEVAAAAEAARAAANEDVLFIRAEAEREALRMTGDARRDVEELRITATAEAEKLVEDAGAEAGALADAAQQSTALAEERVKALEQRREELMAELEEMRDTLGELEDQIEGRKAEMTHATTDPSESSVRILSEEKPAIGDWLDDDATVRLLPPVPVMPLDPVDADELVAEVESLRTSVPVQPAESVAESTAESATSAEIAALDFEIMSDAPATADSSATAEVFVAATPEEEVASPAVDPTPPAGNVAETSEPASNHVPAPDPEEVEPDAIEDPVAGPDDDISKIDDLFAKLRTPTEEAESPAMVEPVEAAATPQITSSAQEADVAPPGDDAGAATSDGPWELRDRAIMPLTNEVLRSIKRQIVEVQNAVLEEVRTESPEWRPKKAMFDAILGQDASSLAERCYATGVEAAGELSGGAVPDLPTLPTHSLVPLVTDLWEAVVDALDGASSGSSRERGASVGRIFRAWRTDEAERRVRQVAHAEYNAGVVAGLNALGVAYAVQPAGRDVADPDAVVIRAS